MPRSTPSRECSSLRRIAKALGNIADAEGPASCGPFSLGEVCRGFGSTCNLATQLNALILGASKGGKRAVWEFDAVRIYDGGADGDGDTTADNMVFLRPGIFMP
jgi:hypothetical protein